MEQQQQQNLTAAAADLQLGLSSLFSLWMQMEDHKEEKEGKQKEVKHVSRAFPPQIPHPPICDPLDGMFEVKTANDRLMDYIVMLDDCRDDTDVKVEFDSVFQVYRRVMAGCPVIRSALKNSERLLLKASELLTRDRISKRDLALRMVNTADRSLNHMRNLLFAPTSV
jgi:hypothetical protein